MIKYNTILKKSQSIVKNVKKEYKLGESSKWSYYIAKAIINNKRDVEKIKFENAPKPTGTHISRQLNKSIYIDLAKQLIKFTVPHKRLPNYLVWEGYKIRTRLYTYMFAKILIYYDEHKEYPKEVNVNSKAFSKPTETTNEVYDYFVKTFGKFNNTIDGALEKIENRGYGHYFNGKMTNKQVIKNLKNKNAEKPNCVDACQLMWNVAKKLGYDVKCIHVKCKSNNEGHVFLKLRHKVHTENSWIIRDPACVISPNNKGIRCVWCEDGKIIDTDPEFFMESLNK